ncbi:MafB family polymorphic toxin [Neisseria meningitidis]|uniref:MafB family polymorphic toxin n=1 Tax=Neisseria meningitidis TaxID=487 RepID=UPI00077AEA46|nr:MafB family polymorphic toxin [Neisseria meningitidis]
MLQIPISHANGLDARLRDDMQAKHYEPGGKYHLFGDGRGSVKNRVYAVQTFDATAVGPILPITHERTGFEGVIGYETHFSGHGHEVHSPFDNHDSRSTSDFSGGVDGGFTVYQLHRTGSEIHPEDGYDGPQGSDYPPPGGARDIYSYYVKGTSTKTKTNIVPQAPFSDRWLKENAGAASGFFSRADEAGKLIWESDPNKNWWANRMDDVRGIVQGAVNPFLMGFQGLGVGAITDSAVNPVTYAAARKTLQGIHNLGNLSPEAQLAAATALQDSAFAVKDGINSAKQWADAHPNITATAQTALSVAEAAGTVWGGKKVELNPTKWDWVKNTDYKTPAARPMQTLDGEMAGGNKPVVKSIRPTTRDELRQALQEQGFRRTGSDAAQYETWKGPDGVKIDIRPNGEVIRTQRVPRTDGVQGKYPQRQDYEGNPLPNNHHHSGYFVK